MSSIFIKSLILTKKVSLIIIIIYCNYIIGIKGKYLMYCSQIMYKLRVLHTINTHTFANCVHYLSTSQIIGKYWDDIKNYTLTGSVNSDIYTT